METNVNEILGTSNSSNNNEVDVQKQKTMQSAKILRTLAKIVLIIGISSGVVISFSTMMVDSGKYTYSKDLVFNPMCIAYLASLILTSVAFWAFSNAIADIVDNTSRIANEIGKK